MMDFQSNDKNPVNSDDEDLDPKSMLPSARGSSSPQSLQQNLKEQNQLINKFEDGLLDISEIQPHPDPNRSTDIVIGEALQVPQPGFPNSN